MRKQIVCAALVLALGVLTAGTASAKVKTRALTFGSDFWVGDTLVKKGTYKVAYDDSTGEVSFNDKKTTVAKTTVKVEKREQVRVGWDVVLAPKGDGVALVRLAFPGDSQALVIGDSSPAGGAQSSGSAVSPPQQ